MADFILSCESTVDLPYSYVSGRNIPVIFYSYIVDGVSYVDDMGRNEDALPLFYDFIKQGKLPTTSQLNEFLYYDFFRDLLQKGDVLHIAFGSGMTPSVGNAYKAAEKLREEFPDRKLVIIDSLCSCSGYGLLVDIAADLRDEGKSLEQIKEYILGIRGKVQHQFFSTDMTMFRRSGRVSGAAAMVSTLLGICPVMCLDDCGKIVAYDKVRGKKNAIKKLVSEAAKHIRDGEDYDGKFFLSNSNCPELAEETKQALEEQFPKLKGKIKMLKIGTITASHCGPGTVAAFFLGDERKSFK